ncbi:MAG: 50S ribosomal protein L25/general stress protein Ctc [Thermodesulfobacteriota bacterium]
MAQSKLELKKRDRVGKGGAREARREGFIPAVLYGRNTEPIALAVDPHLLKEALSTQAGNNTLLELKIEKDKKTKARFALIKEVQYDFLTSKPIHFDFYQVEMDQEITINIPIKITGRSRGVQEGGILEEIMREVEVECVPTTIPNFIDIDVTELDVGKSIHIEQLEFPEGVIPTQSPTTTVVAIVAPSALVAEVSEEEEVMEVVEGAEELEETTEAQEPEAEE